MGISCQNVEILAVGSVAISSTPTGAAITIDNVLQSGTSPQTYTGLLTGSHTYLMTKSGYANATGSFSITDGVQTNLPVTFAPSASFTSSPSGARIWIGVSDTGLNTPNTVTGLTAGSVGFTLKLATYTDFTSNFTATAGQTTAVPLATMTLSTGSAAFISTPTGARIWLGPYLGTKIDQEVNTTVSPGQEITGLTPGMYDYSLVLDGYITATGTITVSAGQKITTTRTLLTVADIAATNVIVTRSSNPCIVGSCTITVDVTWTNTGQTAGDITPTIEFKVGGNHYSTVVKGYTITIQPNGDTATETFAVTGLTAETYTVCPIPN